ncbi:MAG: bifunctional adenosylcobinamide kinase/adenosylcobinamide-phosphate guanylyltransferase [Thermodesulfovibrionia bacterium]
MASGVTFIIGGARSGKSRFALNEASKMQGKKAYIATAEALDEEMMKRIERHKRERPADWDTYEEPLNISPLLEEIKERYDVIIIDCLTLWLSNILLSRERFNEDIERFLFTLKGYKGSSALIIVSNEVGMGIVPDSEMARHFRDMAGFLNQRVAEIADEVYLVVAGIPLKIKGEVLCLG